MLSRHFLRSKVLQTIYASKTDPVDIIVAEKNFKQGIARLNDLGTLQLAALVHLAEIAGVVLEENQHKFLPSEEDLNPILRLPENIFIRRLADNYDLRRHCDDCRVNWSGVEYDEAFRQAFAQLSQLPEYKQYLATEPSFETDQAFALNVFKFIINFEPLCDLLFPQSLFWEDDYDQIAQYNFMMLKALDDTLDEATAIPLVHDTRNQKDVEAFDFAHRLLLATIRCGKEVEDMIRRNLNGWEYDRVAFMDVLLLNMAVAELTEFPSIPERVSVDEYIELAKEFSAERSKLFINGILSKFVIELRSAGRIRKSGRGLYDPDLDSDDNPYNEQ